MTLPLLCRHSISIERAAVVEGPVGDVQRQWQTISSGLAATVLTARGRTTSALSRRGVQVTHVVLLPGTAAAQVGDRISDGTLLYQVHYVSDLGDRGQVTAIFVQELVPA